MRRFSPALAATALFTSLLAVFRSPAALQLEILALRHRETPLWGAPRIHGELLKLGIDIGETSVSKYLNAPGQTDVPELADLLGQPREDHGFR